MLYYTANVECPYCMCRFHWALVAEAEPPPDAVVRPRCPSHAGTFPVPFSAFKACEPFPVDAGTPRYRPAPPLPPPPAPPPAPEPRWWQFWKR